MLCSTGAGAGGGDYSHIFFLGDGGEGVPKSSTSDPISAPKCKTAEIRALFQTRQNTRNYKQLGLKT